ncbi:unnamed protein product [Onchocerca flexuosa]|uniref:Uncharacterized protein n=1 Tax=Onchocerca flexuosa TaxID=387005 RepID=A0A183HYS4_9BILA|nr:unnamed protein product [Onchocerca flexuosa]
MMSDNSEWQPFGHIDVVQLVICRSLDWINNYSQLPPLRAIVLSVQLSLQIKDAPPHCFIIRNTSNYFVMCVETIRSDHKVYE